MTDTNTGPYWKGLAEAGPQESLRHWVQWVHGGQNRLLQDLGQNAGRKSNWDDHGESAAFTVSGMGVYRTFYLPKEIFKISARFGNLGPD